MRNFKKGLLFALFSFFFIGSMRGDCIALDLCDGACGLGCGVGMTATGVGISVFCGMVNHAVALKSNSSFFWFCALLGYATGGILTIGGLRLLSESFKKMVGVKSRPRRFRVEDLELVFRQVEDF